LQGWQRVAGLGAVADCVDGRLIQPCPPAAVQELAGFGVGALGQQARLAGAGRPPSMAEGAFDIGALQIKFRITVLAGCHGRMLAGRRASQARPSGILTPWRWVDSRS
jgi:hypothetical protein